MSVGNDGLWMLYSVQQPGKGRVLDEGEVRGGVWMECKGWGRLGLIGYSPVDLVVTSMHGMLRFCRKWGVGSVIFAGR